MKTRSLKLKKECTLPVARLVMFAVALVLLSCSGQTGDSHTGPGSYSVSFENGARRMRVGDEMVLTPAFRGEGDHSSGYKWKSSDTSVATVGAEERNSARVTAVGEGRATITITGVDNPKATASCIVTVNPSTVRILAIGNSFSQDAVEQYLYELAHAEGIETVIGNLYIGGCSLETHLKNATEGNAAYSYRKIVGGVKTTTADVALSTAIADEDWDYISLQQTSGYSGVYPTFSASLPGLISYVQGRSTNDNMQLMLHQTWAYASNSTHADFPTYDSDQTTMYNAIVSAVDRAARINGVDIVIPAGTAIQNGRTSYLGDTFCRDGYHLETTYGRYTAACTWFGKVFDTDVTSNIYQPAISEYCGDMCRLAAHSAIANPMKITELTAFKSPEAEKENNNTLRNPVRINFGNETSESGWNNVTSISASDNRVSLTDSQGNQTGIAIRVSKSFGGINTNGPTSTSTSLDMPSSVSSSSFWGNTGAAFSGVVTGATELTVSSLNKSQSYTFTFFSSRTASDNREVQFTVTGAETDVQKLNSSGNTSATVTTKAIAPDSEGRVVIRLTSGDNNNNANGFFYLNAMGIAPAQ